MEHREAFELNDNEYVVYPAGSDVVIYKRQIIIMYNGSIPPFVVPAQLVNLILAVYQDFHAVNLKG